jgi:hypothetical protein
MENFSILSLGLVMGGLPLILLLTVGPFVAVWIVYKIAVWLFGERYVYYNR